MAYMLTMHKAVVHRRDYMGAGTCNRQLHAIFGVPALFEKCQSGDSSRGPKPPELSPLWHTLKAYRQNSTRELPKKPYKTNKKNET